MCTCVARADEEAEAESEEPLGLDLDSKIRDESNDLTAPLLTPVRESSESGCYLSKILSLALVWLAFFGIQLLRGSKTTEVRLLSVNPFLCDFKNFFVMVMLILELFCGVSYFGFGLFSGNLAVGKLRLRILVVDSNPNTFGMSCDGVDGSSASQEVFLRRTGGDQRISLLVANFVYYLNILWLSYICIP